MNNSMKISKAVKRALKAGAIPPVRGKVKGYTPKRRGTKYAAPITNIFPVNLQGGRKL